MAKWSDYAYRNAMANPASRQEKLLYVALAPFNSGRRADAIPYLEQIINDPIIIPEYRLSAACLLAEIHRGMGRFESASEYYELALLAAENCFTGNGWYRHYYPKAAFGSLLTYRRLLSDNHTLIKTQLSDARQRFMHLQVSDLQAQLLLIEGLYLRQIGNIEGSISLIRNALEGLSGSEPPFSFLIPEQFEALLTLSYLCSPADTVLASRLARQVLKVERENWSTAIACSVLLHIFFKRILNRDLSDFSQQEFSEEDFRQVSSWIDKLMECADIESDPLVKSEGIMLELIWRLLQQETSRIPAILDELAISIRQAPSPVRLLRAVELGALKYELSLAGCSDDRAAKAILHDGAAVFPELSHRLATYYCSSECLRGWAALLNGQSQPCVKILTSFYSEPLLQLRCRLWP